jgi:hypothetical protein
MGRSSFGFPRDPLWPLRIVRDAVRSIRNRPRPSLGTSVPEEATAAPAESEPKPRRTWLATGWRGIDHLASVLLWLFFIGMGISIVQGVIVGTSGYGGSFGFGNLYIMYDVDCGGLLPERLVYAVILPSFPEQMKGGADNGCTFVFAGHHPVTVRPRRGETVWIDEQYHITFLGRALHAKDVAALRELGNSGRPAISSAEEFLAIVAKLGAKPDALAEPSAR